MFASGKPIWTAAQTTGVPSFGVNDAFSALLTTQSLLFAGVTAAMALGGSTPLGRVLAVNPLVFGLVLTVVLTGVTIGTGAAWWDIYGGRRFPQDWGSEAQAIGLLLGFGSQPFIALAVALSLR